VAFGLLAVQSERLLGRRSPGFEVEHLNSRGDLAVGGKSVLLLLPRRLVAERARWSDGESERCCDEAG
jgi:hypothetical protein